MEDRKQRGGGESGEEMRFHDLVRGVGNAPGVESKGEFHRQAFAARATAPTLQD
jgi:hypothetical protein